MATETEIRIKRDALFHFCPNGFSSSEDIDTYHCVSETTPSKSDLDAKIVELTAEWDAQAYARQRQAGYPSVGDQLDMLMKDMKNGTTTHQTACEAVKAKYPKP